MRSRHSRRSDRDPAADPSHGDGDPALPWIQGGINYGPTLLAVEDLAAWVFDLVAREVVHWPTLQRSVGNVQRVVLARICGQRTRDASVEDVMLTSSLLTRIFEERLSLCMAEMVAILDALGLPTDVVPLRPRPAAGAVAPAPTRSNESANARPFIGPRLRNAA